MGEVKSPCFLISWVVGASVWAAAPSADKLQACLDGRVPFSLREQFPAVKDQFSGTCYAQSAVAMLESAMHRQYGGTHALSVEAALCDWQMCARAEDMSDRVAKVCRPGSQKNFVDGGYEEVLLKSFANFPFSFRRDSAKLRQGFETVFWDITRAVKDGSVRDVVTRNAFLEEAVEKLPPAPSSRITQEQIKDFEMRSVVEHAELLALRETGENGKEVGPAGEYLRFVNEVAHPDYLNFVFGKLESLLTPAALARWRALHGPDELRRFAQDLRRTPSEFLKTHRRDETLIGEERAKSIGLSRSRQEAEALIEKIFGLDASGLGFEEGSLIRIFDRSRETDLQKLRPNVRSRYEKLVKSCEASSASVRKRVLHYLCAGVPVLAGVDLPGYEFGRDRGTWSPTSVRGAGLHAMVLMGVGPTRAGQPAFLFRNSWGWDSAQGRSGFRNACQLQQLSVYLTPKDREKLKALYGAKAAPTPEASH